MKKHRALPLVILTFVLFSLVAGPSHAAALLEIEKGECGDFQIKYKGKAIFTNRLSGWSEDERKYSNPCFVSLKPNWHGVRMMGMGQPVEAQETARDGKQVLRLVEKTKLGEVSSQISLAGSTAEIEFSVRIEPNNPSRVEMLNYTFPLSTEMCWGVPFSDNGEGYKQPQLDQTWLSLLKKEGVQLDSVRYNFTRLQFECPEAVITYLFDGPPKSPDMPRNWALSVDGEKNISLSEAIPFSRPEGIDLKFTITITVEPR